MPQGSVTLWTVFLSEAVGTAVLLLLGVGVVANVVLKRSKGQGGGWLLISTGWAIAVFAGVVVAYPSGAHLNPAVTIGVAASGATEFVPGIPVDAASIAVYLGGQLLGSMVGALLAYLVYKLQFDATDDAPGILSVFSTGPEVRRYGWNLLTEVVATFVLVFAVLAFPHSGSPTGLASLGALPVSLIVLAIGMSLGGPTGYAINPVRDLGPRIIHALVPIRAKGASDWAYAWVPIVGPLIGGAAAGLLSPVLRPVIG